MEGDLQQMQALSEQIEAYERSSTRFGGGGTADVHELEMWLSFSLGLLGWLKGIEQDLRTPATPDRSALEEVFGFYERWYAAAPQLLSRIERMRHGVITVRHADEFEAVVKQGWLQGASPASVQQGIDDF